MLAAIRYEGNTLICHVAPVGGKPDQTEFLPLDLVVAQLKPSGQIPTTRVTLEIKATFALSPTPDNKVSIQLGASLFERMNVDFSHLTVLDLPDPIQKSVASQLRQRETGLIIP